MLCEIASDLWVAEEPLRYLGFEMGRRMAVIRLAGGGLLVHSPVSLSDGLRDELAELGEVRFLVPASILPGHGEIVETGGKEMLKRDFAWLLRDD
jgi:hypothetical protein